MFAPAPHSLPPPLNLPERSLMERGRQGEQTLAYEVKEKPDDEQSQQTLANPERPDETAPLQQGNAGQLAQTVGADDAIVVFGNAFPTKELAATGAARHRLPFGVVKASLISQVAHLKERSVPGEPPRAALKLPVALLLVRAILPAIPAAPRQSGATSLIWFPSTAAFVPRSPEGLTGLGLPRCSDATARASCVRGEFDLAKLTLPFAPRSASSRRNWDLRGVRK